jgi:hypothetical protein
VVDLLAQPQQAGAVADDLRVDGGRRGGGRVVAQGMGGETTPAPAGYPTLPDPTLIG